MSEGYVTFWYPNQRVGGTYIGEDWSLSRAMCDIAHLKHVSFGIYETACPYCGKLDDSCMTDQCTYCLGAKRMFVVDLRLL